MKSRSILVLILGALGIPIILNWCIGRENPTDIQLIASPSDWLLFYGSYIGGVITAIIGFVTLHRQTSINKIQLEIKSKEDALKELKHSLAEQIGLFDFSKVTEISLFYKEREMYNAIQRNLAEYQNNLASKANAWAVIYAYSECEHVIRFKDAYIDCYEEFTKNINGITKAICHLSKAGTDEQIASILRDEITPINQETEHIQAKLQILFNAAQEWIREEGNEIVKLKEML